MTERSRLTELLEELTDLSTDRPGVQRIPSTLEVAVVELLRREQEREKSQAPWTEVPASASIGDMVERAQAEAARDPEVRKRWEMEAAACGAILAERRLGAMRQLAEYALGLIKEATNGPWAIGRGYEPFEPGHFVSGAGRIVCAMQEKEDIDFSLSIGDAKFIAAARTLLPIFAEMVLAMTGGAKEP